MPKINLHTRRLLASRDLRLALISLDEWNIVDINGPDHLSYLQSQVTIDVTTLLDNQHVITAHCNSKGKICTTIRLFHRGNGLAYITRRNMTKTQLNILKNYSVFSKTNIITDKNAVLLGIAGDQSRYILETIFKHIPNSISPVVQSEENILLWFGEPAERFLLITTKERAAIIRNTLKIKAQLYDSAQWLALEIEAGLPIIDSCTSFQFLPQEANLQELHAISFNKGCYIGQEIIARTKFHNANKRSLYWLTGTAERIPEAGDSLETKIRNHWRHIGTVLAACQIGKSTISIQAILRNNLPENTALRLLSDDTSRLLIQYLPYKLYSKI
ncbi:tRNA-modifying protein YgfZ [Candidatus Erwinia haradaeae]|uniref:tRNA-modifying protein YgfZ n=1 Tax=Candidatus Erwinia haradaeae TaxID=1922217 RepID=A0A803GD17_9GAMM|nr:tRNA-modifying protein YgfZ [Candidatus Erwinia haradaeae]VFP88461.1 tRNA-modifying protein YgfZ [Candidatus Erwinia haradaeae]